MSYGYPQQAGYGQPQGYAASGQPPAGYPGAPPPAGYPGSQTPAAYPGGAMQQPGQPPAGYPQAGQQQPGMMMNQASANQQHAGMQPGQAPAGYPQAGQQQPGMMNPAGMNQQQPGMQQMQPGMQQMQPGMQQMQPGMQQMQPGMQHMQPGMQQMQPGMQQMQPGMQQMQPGMQHMQPGMQQQQPGYGMQQPYGAPMMAGYPAGAAGYGQQMYAVQAAWNPQALVQMMQQQQLAELQMWFTSIDTDRSGTITATELAKAHFGPITISTNTARALINVFDVDKSNSMNLQEFQACHGFVMKMIIAFQANSKTAAGRTTIDQAGIVKVFSENGFTVTPATAAMLCNKFSSNSATNATYGAKPPATPPALAMEEYLCAAAWCGHMRTEFTRLGGLPNGVIQLNFDQLVSVVSSL